MPAMVTLYKTAWGKVFRIELAAGGQTPKLILGQMIAKLLQVSFGYLNRGNHSIRLLHWLLTRGITYLTDCITPTQRSLSVTCCGISLSDIRPNQPIDKILAVFLWTDH